MSVLSCPGLSQMNTQWQAAFFRKHNHAVHRVVVMAILFGFFLLFYFLSAHNGRHGLVATRKGQLLENSCYSDLGQEGACVKPDVLFSVDHPSVAIPITGARQVAASPPSRSAKKKTKIFFSCDSGDEGSQKPRRKQRRQHGPAPVGRQRQHDTERVDISNILPQRQAFMPRLRTNLVRNVLEKLRQPTLLALPVPPLQSRTASRSEAVPSPSSARARCSSGVDAAYNGKYIDDTPGYASGASPQMHRHTERNRAVHGVEFQRKYRYNKHVAGFRGFRGFPPHLVTNRSSHQFNSRGIGPGPGITDVSTCFGTIPEYRYPGKHMEWEKAKNPYLIRRRSFKKGPQRSKSSEAARKTSFADVTDLTGDAFKRSYDNNPGIASVEARQGYHSRKSTPFVYGGHANHIEPSTRSFSTMRTRRTLISDEFDVPRIDGDIDESFTNPYVEFMRPVPTPNRGTASSNVVHSSSSRPHNGAREEREFRNIRSRANAAADRRSNGSSRGEDDTTTSESGATALRNDISSRDNTRVESGALARARARTNFAPRNGEVMPRDSTRFRTHTGGGPLNSDNRATIPVISLYPNDPYPSILDERTSRAYRVRSREGHLDLSYRLVPRGSFPDGGPDSAISRPFPGVLSPGRTSGRNSRNPTHMRLTASEARGLTLRIMNPWVGGSGSFSTSF